MNVLKPHLQVTVKTLLGKGISQREINRKTGVDRKTIRKYGRIDGLVAGQGAFASKSPSEQEMATGADVEFGQNPHPGHRLDRASRPSMLAVPASHTESGSKIR